MKVDFRVLIIIFILSSLVNAKAQIAIPQDYFSSPLNIGLGITGSFAEIRSNHFHSGIDFQVQKKEGLPVFAVADGFVSRIKVSPVGFGNALYIDHPNGFTSVYAHMQRYSDTITAYLRENQYKQKSFEVDLFPALKKDFIFVRKGEIIGYAGNSGSSGGAHLHFELRNTKTERIINPLLFGFDVSDKYPPAINFIRIYPEDESSCIGSRNEIVRFNVKKSDRNSCHLASGDTLNLWGNFSFGAEAFDYHQNLGDHNGFYSLNMFVDEAEIFLMQCDSFAFSESRFVNATIDYADNYNTGSRIVKSKMLPGNQMSFLKSDTKNGIASFIDGKIHKIEIAAGDLAGNTTILTFWVRSMKPEQYIQVPMIVDADTLVPIRFNKNNVFETDELKVEFPLRSLYEDIVFRYRKMPGGTNQFSSVHYLHDAEVPLQNRIRVSVKPTKLPVRLRTKALLVRINRDGSRSPAGGSYENGYVTATTNMFDGYAVVVDTIAPVIKPYADNARNKSRLRFTVSDNFSGISKYTGEVNGEWVLVEWDPKNKLMMYTFDQVAQPGKNTFVLYLEDEKGNKSKYKTTFTK